MMKVGDLVELRSWCKNGGKRAIIVRVNEWDRNTVYIEYLDSVTEGSRTLTSNLILVSSS